MGKIIPNAKITTLDNGIRIVTEELPHLRSVSLGLIVGAGAVFENKDNSGVSHFIEHMLFKGTSKRTAFEIASEIDGVGGKLNAFTGKEYTCYYAVVEDKHFGTAADVLSDMLLNSAFKEEDIALEKNVVLEEIKMYEDTPDEQIHDLFMATALKSHGLGNPILGTEESVTSFKREAVLSYMKNIYCPQNLIISVAGNISGDDVADLFSGLFKASSGKNGATAGSAPEISSGIMLKSKKTEQVHFILGTKGMSHTDDRKYALSLLDNLLGGTMSSRLFQEIREKRALAYSIHSFSQGFKDSGIFSVYAGTKKETFEETFSLILKELKKVKDGGISKEELSRSKEYVKGSMVLALESSRNRMSYIAKSLFYYDRIVPIDEVVKKIDEVSFDDVTAIANELFAGKFMSLAVIGDLEKLPIKEIRI
ncbi:MAG: pitrilysin family protein [Candidatus Margulisiibacteriota bacterium]